MLISYNWLKQFIPDLTEQPKELAESLSCSLAEVENLRQVGDDYILEIENKALGHRPDLFGQAGLAREVTASLGKNFRYPEIKTLDETSGKIEDSNQIELEITDPKLCPRYSAIILGNIKVQESPTWLQTQLKSVNLRPINYIVDVTNFLMFKHGQPLHAFDLDKLENRGEILKIIIRLAQAGETLVLLDDSQLTLTENDLLITYQSNSSKLPHPIALAGIMGGKAAEITNQTQNILLESANFNQYGIRAASRRHSQRSEASLRFEKGIDPEMTIPVLQEAVYMITGKEASVDAIADQYQPLSPQSPPITLHSEQINQYLNINMTVVEITDKLRSLDFKTKIAQTGQIEVTIPSFRPDVKIKEDLYEEIGRLYDYNQIVPTLPKRTLNPPQENKLWTFNNKLKKNLVQMKLTEVLNYSFVEKESVGIVTEIQDNQLTLSKKFDQTDLKLKNPVAPEFAYLRSSLIPGLIKNIIENAKRFNEFGLFEIGLVTFPQENQLPIEPELLTFVYYNQKQDPQEVLVKTKSLWRTLVDQLNITNDLCDLTPLDLNLGDTQGFAFAYEIDISTLFEQHTPTRFTSIPLSPPTMQDISFIIEKNQPVGEIVKEIQNRGGEHLKKVELIDVYQNENLQREKQKSVTLRLTFQHPQKSLADKEINPIREKIEEYLKETYTATIR